MNKTADHGEAKKESTQIQPVFEKAFKRNGQGTGWDVTHNAKCQVRVKKNPNKRLLSGAFNAFQCSLQTFFVIAKRQIGKRADSKPLPS